MSFLSSLDISGSALSALRTRSDIITQNISMASTYKTEDGTPYRRQMVVFRENKSFKQYFGESKGQLRNAGVRVAAIVKDESPLTPVYEPENPDADADGYIYMPNVNNAVEQADLLEATNSYNANLTAMNRVMQMYAKAMEIGK